MCCKTVFLHAKHKNHFLCVPTNVTVLKKRSPFIKADAVVLLLLLVLYLQWKLFWALLELAGCKSLMEVNDRLPKATVSFH